jgi:16S rRNA (adenine(1408)-N(1))-methyltransferase
VLGVDADARAMAESSRRAAARPSRGGLPNACFVVSGVEQMPAAIDGLAGRLTVRFPWGSLLRGALGCDDEAAASIARLVAPDGRLELTLSVTARDRAAGDARGDFGPADVECIATTFGSLGLTAVDVRRLTAPDVAATGSSWACRLGAARGAPDRSVWRVTMERSVASSATVGRPPGAGTDATSGIGSSPLPSSAASRRSRR